MAFINYQILGVRDTTALSIATGSLTDTFDSGFDAKKWVKQPSTGTINFINNEVEFVSSTSSGYNAIESIQSYDLTGSFISTQLVSAGNQSIPSLESILYFRDAVANNKLFWLIGDVGSIGAYKVINGVQTSIATGSYNASVHKYFRIRESGGTTYFDYSTDGLSWTNFTSLANPFSLTFGRVALQQGTWQNETLTSTVKWDNFNVAVAITAPTGYASWAASTISQPYVPVLNINPYSVSTLPVVSYAYAVNMMASLQDDFEFGGLDNGKWVSFGGSQVVVGTNLDLEMSSILGGDYVGINTIANYNLTGSSIFIQLKSAGDQTITSWEVYPIYLIADNNNRMFIRIAGNTVQPMKVVNNVTTNVGTGVTYNATTMKWFRVRESVGTTYFEYAQDPTSTWTIISSTANPILLTSMIAEVLVGTWQAEISTTTAIFDNVNVIPGSLQFNWSGNTWNKRIQQGNPGQIWSQNNISGPDGNGYVTIKITNVTGGDPLLAEFFSVRRGFGYGTYTTVIATELDTIGHPSSFGGMFTFDFTAPPDYKEIDVNETRDYNGLLNKQILKSHAYNNSGSRSFITDNMNITSDVIQTHRLIWTPTSLTFDSFVGAGTSGTNYFHAVHTTNLPTPGLERVHFNIWIDPNISGYLNVPELDVIIRSFDFEPLGYSAWASKTISQPYFTPYDENMYFYSPNVVTYKAPPLPPVGEASWLNKTVSQPLFLPPSDPNQIVAAKDWLKALATGVAPIGIASWVNKSISQPIYLPFDTNPYIVFRSDISTYAKPPAPPISEAGWLYKSISQPFFSALDITPFKVPPVDVGTYFTYPPPSNPEAEWLSKSIYQPYFTPYDENWLVWPANITTYFQRLSPPTGILSLLQKTISQPTYIPFDINIAIWEPKAATYFQKPFPPVGEAAWLAKTVSQPYFIPFDENVFIYPARVSTYDNKLTPPIGIASWLDDSISQPFFIPFDGNRIPKVTDASVLQITKLVPPGFSSWAKNTISQPGSLLTNNDMAYNRLVLLAIGNQQLFTRLLMGVGL